MAARPRRHGDGRPTELQTALAGWSSLGRPFETARAGFELGRVLVDASADTAVEHLRRSLAGFEALGAAGRRIVSPPCSARSASPAPAPRASAQLTDREQQVLRLLAAGLTNPEIAARLHVSRKTAAHHVSHILTKLNLRNRAEAAAFARRDLLPDRNRAADRCSPAGPDSCSRR